MTPRRSIRLPITLGVVMMVLLVALIVGWITLTVREVLAGTPFAGLYWTLLSVGTVFLVLVLLGVVMYLTLSVKAIRLSQRQSNFIDSVTHELKSPLASLKLYVQTLDRRQVTEAQQANFYRIMLEDLERLDGLINHLLEAAKLEQEPSEDGFERVELPGLLARCAEAACLRHHVEGDVVQLESPSCWVHGRRHDVEVVFRNLLDNAVKYAGSPPHVRVVCAPGRSGQVLIKIIDNGAGIPLQFRWKIFHRFFRLGQELERQKPGTGLGLYIVRTLVGRMKGRVAVHDGPGGVGTSFDVSLPGAMESADAHPPAPSPARAATLDPATR